MALSWKLDGLVQQRAVRNLNPGQMFFLAPLDDPTSWFIATDLEETDDRGVTSVHCIQMISGTGREFSLSALVNAVEMDVFFEELLDSYRND